MKASSKTGQVSRICGVVGSTHVWWTASLTDRCRRTDERTAVPMAGRAEVPDAGQGRRIQDSQRETVGAVARTAVPTPLRAEGRSLVRGRGLLSAGGRVLARVPAFAVKKLPRGLSGVELLISGCATPWTDRSCAIATARAVAGASWAEMSQRTL